MNERNRRTTVASALILLTALAARAGAAPAMPEPPDVESWTTEDWQREVTTLREQVGTLQDQVRVLTGAEDAFAAERETALRGLIADVLADADTRAGFFQETAGYDDGFFIASPDGDFRLEITGQLQARFVYNYRADDNGDETTTGFEMRRVKLKFAGDVGENVGFSIKGAFNRVTGTFLVNDAVIKLDLKQGVRLQIGRARATLLREEWVSSKRQLAAERSIVARRFRQLRTVGLALHKRTDQYRFGIGIADTAQELFGVDGWLASTRLELLLKGNWRELNDFTSFRDDEPTFMIGAGALYAERDEDTLFANAETFRWTADVNAEFGGASFFASIVGNHDMSEEQVTRNQLGVVVQGSYFLSNEFEMFARYEWGDADGAAPDLSVITVGLNRYIFRHHLKWTVDVGYGLSEVTGFWSTTGGGWRSDRPGNDGQVVFRAQLQLLF